MRELTREDSKYLRQAQFLALVQGIMFPIVLLGPVAYGSWSNATVAGKDWIFYLLLVVSAIQPKLQVVIKNSFVGQGASLVARKPAAQWYLTLSLVRFAMIGSIYVYSAVVYFLWHDLGRMLTFYPIGLAWVAVYWPRKKECAAFIEEMEKNVKQP